MTLVAEIRLGRPQVVPIGFGLHAERFDRDGLALDAEQPLDHALRVLVATFAEVLVPNHALRSTKNSAGQEWLSNALQIA